MHKLPDDCDCRACLGCYRLEVFDFKGKYNCKHFKSGYADKQPKIITGKQESINANSRKETL